MLAHSGPCRCEECLWDEVHNGPDVPLGRLTNTLTLKEAKKITGGLTRTTKLPGYSYSIDPLECQKGAELAQKAGTPCANCYALRGWYMVGPAAKAIAYRQEAIRHPKWVEAMVFLLKERCQPPLHWFRWHDAGDLQGAWHLSNIVRVVRQTPWVRHWLATRETEMVAGWVKENGEFPDNLMVRISADRIGEKPELPPELKYAYTSTLHRFRGHPVQIGDDPSLTVECRAVERGNRCDKCRACWSGEVQNVSYVEH